MAFNVQDFVTGQMSYPERRTSIYFNGRVGDKLAELKKIKDPSAKVKKEIKDLEAELEKSKLVFLLRGFPLTVRTAIENEVEELAKKQGLSESEKSTEFAYRLYAKAVISVTDPDGNVNEDEWTAEDIRNVIERSPNGAPMNFIQDCAHVTVQSIKFDNNVDVPF